MLVKKLMKATLLSLAVVALFSNAIPAEAEVLNSVVGNGEVTFLPGDEDDLNPTDPERPETPDPLDPEDPDPDPIGEEGLYLVMTPRLDFGAVKISKKDMSYYAKAEYLQNMNTNEYFFRSNYIEVLDIRGNEAGWTISVVKDGQFQSEDGNILEGARIVFKNGWINSGMIGWQEQDVWINEEFVLNPDDTQIVFSASKGSGGGRWYGVFGDSEKLEDTNTDGKQTVQNINGEDVVMKFNPSVLLEVPGESEKLEKDYATTLLWTISDTP